MQIQNEYDVAIIGGGLAGLSAAIQLKQSGHSVILFEKEKYPFHKVCGEYISLESWSFLESLGVPLQEMKLPIIDTLFLTAPNGKSFTTKLPVGGFGISRHKLDNCLADIAREAGVHLVEETKVDSVSFDEKFRIHFKTQQTVSKVCCAAYGKRSNLDVKWKRRFLSAVDKRMDNFIGVKYHIKTDGERNVIGMHNFENGYCGISKIDGEKYCLCYMTKAENLKNCDNNIHQLQEKILYKNPHLKKLLLDSEICDAFPITISQINFNKKTQVEEHILMLGDAAGIITPLSGNGMSIALHTGKIASQLINDFLRDQISQDEMELEYSKLWKQHFSKRIRTGRILQRFFGSVRLSNLFVQTFKLFPFLSKPLIKMTHGKPF